MKYSKVYEPRISEYDKNGKLSLGSVIGIIEDTGAKHSASVNDDIIASGLKGVSWILVEWNIEINKIPKNNQKLYMETWPVCKKAEFITNREYEMKDENGNVYIHACERLVLEDFNAGKMLKVTPELLEAYSPEPEVYHEFDFSKLKVPENYDTELQFRVRASDIDYNKHVHNTHYIDYALDAIEQAGGDTESVSGFRLHYKKPLTFGDCATAKCKICDNGYLVGIYKDETLCTLVQIKKSL